MATTRPDVRSAAQFARANASGLALLSVVMLSKAASPALQPSIDIRAVATDNAALAPAAQRQGDVIGDVDAGLIVRSRGARLNVTGDAGLDFIGYANHTEPDRVLPRGHLDLTAILVERALFFDGDLSASRTRSDPLAAQAGGASTANTVSTASLRASPYFAHDFSPTVSATLRSDTTVTRNKSDDTTTLSAPNGSTYQRDSLSIVRRPTPVGLSVDASHEDTTYQDSATPVLRTDSARATLSAALDPDFIAGVVAGREHTVYSTTSEDDTRYGLVAQWRPSARTQFDADVEHRFFGTGWTVHFRDRMSRSIVDFSLVRAPSASPSTFGVTAPDSDPATLLGALLSSRAPNVGARDQEVDDLVETRALPDSFNQPLDIISESAQLSTRATLNVILNGVRDTVYASAYYQKAEALPGEQAANAATTFDSSQWGGSLGIYHRLMPDVSAAAEIAWSAIDALGARTGDSSHQVAGTLSLTRRLGPRTSLSCGFRHFSSRVVLGSTSSTTQVRENQAFAGLRVQY